MQKTEAKCDQSAINVGKQINQKCEADFTNQQTTTTKDTEAVEGIVIDVIQKILSPKP